MPPRRLEAYKQKPRPQGRGFRFQRCREAWYLNSVLGDDRAVEVVVQAGAEDVLGDLGGRGCAGGDQVGAGAEIDIKIFGLGGPGRSEQAEQLEGGLDAAADRVAVLGLGQA